MATWTAEMVLNRAVAMENQSYGLYVWARDRALNSEAKTLLKELARAFIFVPRRGTLNIPKRKEGKK